MPVSGSLAAMDVGVRFFDCTGCRWRHLRAQQRPWSAHLHRPAPHWLSQHHTG